MLSNEEIKALISSLGVGISSGEYDVTKLRYHKVVIMTDADVDGSHIRTLLLTFFYRQMPEVIERGHLYIAQPPLYKVKKGKKEQYLKNEQDRQEFLFSEAIADAAVVVGGKTIEPSEFKSILKNITRFENILATFSLRHGESSYLTELILDQTFTAQSLKSESELKSAISRAEAKVKSYFDGVYEAAVSIEDEPEHQSKKAKIDLNKNGIRSRFWIDNNLVTAPEFQELKKMTALFAPLGPPPYTLRRLSTKEEEKLLNLRVLAERIEEIGSQGLSLQRYKGLGEMNPEQLWETTMDPVRRTLLQVHIDDAVESDKIFSLLMGDLVEPRREFIEQNALKVRNLDI
jgi:DNA gyrase subunit B